jgi:hypothetical protein
MGVEIGYLLPTRERVMQDEPGTAELLRLAAKAEALGYDSLWAGDSLLARPRHDPLTLLAAVAARTTRPRLGIAVLLPVLRNPVVLAQQVATLDQVSEGRLVLGVGIGAAIRRFVRNSPPRACPSSAGSVARSRDCVFAVRSGRVSPSPGADAGCSTGASSGRYPTARAGHRSGWARASRRVSSAPADTSMAGFPSDRMPRLIALVGPRCRRVRGMPAAPRR